MGNFDDENGKSICQKIFFDEPAELFSEMVHEPLESGPQVEHHNDREVDIGDCGKEILFYGITLFVGRFIDELAGR